MRPRLLIGASLLLALTGLVAIQFPAKRKYDELREHFVGSDVFTEEMSPADEKRIEEVRTHWKKVEAGPMVSATTELLAELDFTPDVAGLAAIYCYEVPAYSFIDLKGNKRNSAILAFLNLSALPPGTRIALGDGEAFVEYKRIAEHYQDIDDVIIRELYFNEPKGAESGSRGGLTPGPHTTGHTGP